MFNRVCYYSLNALYSCKASHALLNYGKSEEGEVISLNLCLFLAFFLFF